MTKIISAVGPKNLVSYNNLKVAFYDVKNPAYREEDNSKKSEDNSKKSENPEYLLYVHILNSKDKSSIVRRKATKIRVRDRNNETQLVEETVVYKTAYDLYLKLKEEDDLSNNDPEKEALLKRIAELEKQAQEGQSKVARPKAKSKAKDKPLAEK